MKQEQLADLNTQQLYAAERAIKSRISTAIANYAREEVKEAQIDLCYVQREIYSRAVREAWPRISGPEELKLVLVENRKAYESDFEKVKTNAIHADMVQAELDANSNYPEYEGNQIPENVQYILNKKVPEAQKYRASKGIYESKAWNLN